MHKTAIVTFSELERLNPLMPWSLMSILLSFV